MLKSKNHRDGFQDTIDSSVVEPDAIFFSGMTDRSRGMKVGYTMVAQSKNTTFSVSP
jgi:hypothetical protein